MRSQRSAPRASNKPQDGKRAASAERANVENSDHGVDRTHVQMDGTRKLWGTHKTSTTGEIKGAISMLANIAAEDLTVKRKFKTTEDGKHVSRWWFVLRAEESVLKI